MTALSTRSLPTPRRRPRLVRAILAMLAAAAVAIPMLLLQAPAASAHCDSATGPVVTAAREALETRDVKRVLPYVKANQEQELTAAFNQTLAIRSRGPEVQALADQYFLETTVRLHRIGEGASYTGIKDEVEADPALEAAEKSLEQGKPDEVITVLDQALRAKVAERFQGVLDARAAEKASPTVATSRERVEAELIFEKYVLEIGGAIHGGASDHGAAAGEEAAAH